MDESQHPPLEPSRVEPPSGVGSSVEVSVVVPTYHEVENIPLLVPRVDQALRSAGLLGEIIIVDDNSCDGSEEVVARLAQEGRPVRIIVRTTERGLSTAVLRGFDESAGRYLACMDADLSHPPEALPAMIELLRGGDVDFVIGSRYCPGGSTDAAWGVFRWLNSRVAMMLAWPLTQAYDPMSGYFAMPREAYRRASGLNPIGYKIALELMIKCRCRRILEVPIHFADRRLGTSKLSVREQLNYLRHLRRLYAYRLLGR
jgi:dolichol-phosphate mannosyltransferase